MILNPGGPVHSGKPERVLTPEQRAELIASMLSSPHSPPLASRGAFLEELRNGKSRSGQTMVVEIRVMAALLRSIGGSFTFSRAELEYAESHQAQIVTNYQIEYDRWTIELEEYE